MDPLAVWCNADLPEPAAALLREGIAPHRLVPAEVPVFAAGGGRVDARLGEADVAFGQPDPRQAASSPRLRWVHLTSAGYTAFDGVLGALRARGAALTKSSMVYDDPCAQHVLAFMLAEARQLPAAARAAGGWPQRELRARSYLLAGQTVAIVGMGSIGRRLAELLAPLRPEVVALRRKPTGHEGVPTLPMAAAPAVLAAADHVVNLLPASAQTHRYFDAARLAGLKPGAVFYNIGRGTTVDQEALAHVLRSGHLRAAYLDVTDPEPLPPDHPLWITPGCVITPHVAGGHAGEAQRLVRHFLENLGRFAAGRELLDRVV